jgi:hypothetical protein
LNSVEQGNNFVRRFTRLAHAFSKETYNLKASRALHFRLLQFCRIDKLLARDRRSFMERSMNASPIDQQLLQLVSGAAPASIPDVITVLQTIDSLLPNNDGLKWFNRLYVMVTNEIDANPPAGGWSDPTWLTRLDVVFANLYFTALGKLLQSAPDAPSAWEALFEARFRPGVDRIQFALAGMNAHINHDLALALLETDGELNLTPDLSSPEHNDYEHVNGLLEAVLPSALQVLATGILGEAAQDTGKIGRLLAIWNIRAARDLAWDFADHLRSLSGVSRELSLTAQDQLTGVIGRSLLLSV